MHRYKITLKIKSDTLFSSAEGSAAVDSSTKAYPNGLPYIPAKTFKGLLKESAIEVLEIMGETWDKENPNDTINQLFGQEGVGNNGKLQITNGDLKHIEKYKKEIHEYKLSPTEVYSFFTKVRHQTSMDSGVAKKGSLRSFNVLKPHLTFKFYVETRDKLSKEEKDFLNKACSNLRRVGMNRNRGFGVVNTSRIIKLKQQEEKENKLTSNTFKMTLITPALLPSSQTDANTVSSEKIISGRKILGMLALAYIKKNKLQENAHQDTKFKRLFLEGSVQFSHAFPINQDQKICMPLGNHWMTNKSKDEVYNDYEDNGNINLKSIGGLVSQNGESKANVLTILDFHNSRNKVHQDADTQVHSRISGSNKGAGIFYYEKLQANQSFVFHVSGTEEDLKTIRTLLKNDKLLRLGKSSSTNLGRIKIDNWGGEWPTGKKGNDESVVITFVTPVILKNDLGEYSPTLKTLGKYLNINTIAPEDSRIRTKKVQVFQGKIAMQLPEMLAIAPGSSIMLSQKQLSNELLSQQAVGEFMHEGYGQFIIEMMSKKDNLRALFKQKDGKKDETKQELPSNGSKLLNFIRQEREILKARKAGNDKAGSSGLHKNTTMLMIALMKEVIFSIHSGNTFADSISKALYKQFIINVYSKKTVESLEKILGKLKDNIKKMRKEKPDVFKEELKKWITTELTDEVKDFTSDRAKAEFWLTFFNRKKINNR